MSEDTSMDRFFEESYVGSDRWLESNREGMLNELIYALGGNMGSNWQYLLTRPNLRPKIFESLNEIIMQHRLEERERLAEEKRVADV